MSIQVAVDRLQYSCGREMPSGFLVFHFLRHILAIKLPVIMLCL